MSQKAPESSPTTTTTTPTMKVDPARAAALVSQLQSVQAQVAAAVASSSSSSSSTRPVRIVAVSKLKPANDVLALHQAPTNQLHFGENYAQELRDKAALLPRTIHWHFIGGLQSGHCKNLAKIPNLWAVSSIDTLKKAKLLDSSRASSLPDALPIRVHVQVNTSGEAAKSGCQPGPDTVALCRAILEDCPRLRLQGLMTIGAIARSKAVEVKEGGENPDFVALRQERDAVQEALADLLAKQPDGPSQLELSMGMSEDFVSAIKSGSDEVRVGSTIFGLRPAKADAKLIE